MLKKTITYTDFNGEERSEDFYFDLMESEIVEIEMGTTGGLSEMINRIVNTQDIPSIIEIFKDLILKAYGERSDDGKKFIKVRNGVRLSEEFSQSNAYSVLFMELATDPKKAADFFNALIPQKKSENNKENNS